MCLLDRTRACVILGVIVMVACSKSAPPTPPESARAPAPVLVKLQPITISFRGLPIARLFADGRTESAGPNAPGTGLVPGPTLRADGTIALTRGGITARLDARGDIYVASPSGSGAREQLFGRIAGEQFTFARSTRPWSVRVRGNVIEFGETNSSVIDGDVTPGMRHTALVMAAAFYIDGAITQ